MFSDEVRERLFDGGQIQPLVLVAERPRDVDDVRRRVGPPAARRRHPGRTYNRDRDWSEQLSLQAYVLSEQERALLVAWLLESLRDPELAEQAMTLLFHFQAPELLVADEHPDREVPFPLVVLLDALGHVLALPVEVSYTLPEALQRAGQPFPASAERLLPFPAGAGLRAEPIHAAWYRGKTDSWARSGPGPASGCRRMWALLQGMRQHAADAIFAWPAKFTLPTRQEFADPLLSRLAFFARYESLLRCLELRHARCEPRPVQLLLGQVMELGAQARTGSRSSAARWRSSRAAFPSGCW